MVDATLTVVSAARDAAAAETFGVIEALWRTDVPAGNASTPGLVRLCLDLSAAAAEPDHPACDFFEER